jgi:hypothetical protein
MVLIDAGTHSEYGRAIKRDFKLGSPQRSIDQQNKLI